MRSLRIYLLSALLAASLSMNAWAKGGTPQNHHCMKDGAEMAGKTRKECKKEGGTWEKMAAAEKSAEGGSEGKADAKPDAK
jgi:hypothetical protein